MHVFICLLLTQSIAKQVILNTSNLGAYVKGAKVQILSPTTVDIGDNKFNIIVNSDSDEWALWINMDNTWGYDTTSPSRFTMTLPGNTDCDMLLSFTDGLESPSSKYFTMIVRLDGNGFNMIAPGCDSNLLNPTRNLLSGDVYWVMAPGPSQAPGNRGCRPAYINTSHPCDYDAMGTASDATSWPLTFIIENYPAQNRMTVTFEGNGYAATSCAFNEHIPVNTGHNIYITGQSVNDNYEITQILLKYELLSPATTPTTSLPTTSSPTTKQPTTNNPTTATPTTLNPTTSPTTSNPTTPNPTPLIPTTIGPSIQPTHNPIVSPTTYSPTLIPIVTPTTNVPTLDTTHIPTMTPTTNTTTIEPTSRPTNEGEHVEYTTMENTDDNELSESVMSTTAILMIIIIILLALILLCCIVVCAKNSKSRSYLRDKYAKDAEPECIDRADADIKSAEDDAIVASINNTCTDMSILNESDDDYLIETVNHTDRCLNGIEDRKYNEDGDNAQVKYIMVMDRGSAKHARDNVIGENSESDEIIEGINYDLNEDGAKRVRIWLKSIEFGGYYDIFVQNGFDSMKLVEAINNKHDLNDIGITLKAHQIAIMNHINQLKQ